MYAASPLNKPSAEPDRATVHPFRRDTPVTSRYTRSEGVQCLRIGCTATRNKHNRENLPSSAEPPRAYSPSATPTPCFARSTRTRSTMRGRRVGVSRWRRSVKNRRARVSVETRTDSGQRAATYYTASATSRRRVELPTRTHSSASPLPLGPFRYTGRVDGGIVTRHTSWRS